MVPTPERSLEKALEQRLAEQVPDERLRRQVYAVVVGARAVIRDLRRLDESLYERLSAGEVGVLESADPSAELARLKDQTFGTLTDLLWAMKSEGLLNSEDARTNIPDELDFDTVDSQPPAPADSVSMDEEDIMGALEGLAPQRPQPTAALMAELRTLLAAVGHSLLTQIQGFEDRFFRSLAAGNHQAAMEDLDDTRNGANEAMYALISGVFQQVMPQVDAEVLVPGYLSTLQRALLVRRALADLTHMVDAQNVVLQDRRTSPPDLEYALGRLRRGLVEFIKADAFTAMRPADRWEFMKFQRGLQGPGMVEVRQTAEGLAKYLESLSSINQREALRRHDAEILRDLAQLMEAATPLLDISPQAAVSQVQEALPLASRLYGRNREVDHLLTVWKLTPPDLSLRSELEEVIRRLTDISRGAGG